MNPLLPLDLATLPIEDFDFLIIGSGVAGLSCAIELAPHGKVGVTTKEDITQGSTKWAQGGIAAVLAPEPTDSPALHQSDTEFAGAGLSDPSAVAVLVREGPQRIRELIARGAHFDTEPNGDLKLTREAAHRARRIVHAQGDSTGREVQRSLGQVAHEDAHISVLENVLTVDLWVERGRCRGAVGINQNGQLILYRAKATIVATGGVGALYKVTTNPAVLTGDGMAMAFRAGAPLMDMEFVQFHPTAFAKGPSNPRFLISEAVRGEGAHLVDEKGERFMPKYHPDAELAPRDVVARAIASEMLESGADWVYLDLTANSAQQIAARFPTIYSTCVAYGIDPATEPIPVAPRRALHDGRHPHRFGRRDFDSRPVGGGRVRLHRRSRRQPFGEQFDARRLGLWHPHRARGDAKRSRFRRRTGRAPRAPDAHRQPDSLGQFLGRRIGRRQEKVAKRDVARRGLGARRAGIGRNDGGHQRALRKIRASRPAPQRH